MHQCIRLVVYSMCVQSACAGAGLLVYVWLYGVNSFCGSACVYYVPAENAHFTACEISYQAVEYLIFDSAFKVNSYFVKLLTPKTSVIKVT